MTGITVHREQWDDALPEMKELFGAHYEEVAADKDLVTLNPAYERYDAMNKLGMLHLVTMRHEGRLVGYILSMVMPHLHYADSLTSFPDVLYVKPQWRNGWSFMRMLKFNETSLKARGVERIYLGVKLWRDFGPLLERMDYKPIERIYTKIIRDEPTTDQGR